jgi:hypothetical protein
MSQDHLFLLAFTWLVTGCVLAVLFLLFLAPDDA